MMNHKGVSLFTLMPMPMFVLFDAYSYTYAYDYVALDKLSDGAQ